MGLSMMTGNGYDGLYLYLDFIIISLVHTHHRFLHLAWHLFSSDLLMLVSDGFVFKYTENSIR